MECWIFTWKGCSFYGTVYHDYLECFLHCDAHLKPPLHPQWINIWYIENLTPKKCMYKMFLKYSYCVVFVINFMNLWWPREKRNWATKYFSWTLQNCSSLFFIPLMFSKIFSCLNNQLNAHQFLCTISELRQVFFFFDCRQISYFKN